MTETYCVRCKKITKDVKPHFVVANGHTMRKSTCAICGTGKNAFVPNGTVIEGEKRKRGRPRKQMGGNPLMIASAVADAAPGIINGIGSAVDQGRRTQHEFNKENGALEVERAQNTGEREKRFQQFYRDLMHTRFWDPEKLKPSLRFPREKTNNPKYAKEQEIADEKLYDYAEKVFGRQGGGAIMNKFSKIANVNRNRM